MVMTRNRDYNNDYNGDVGGFTCYDDYDDVRDTSWYPCF